MEMAEDHIRRGGVVVHDLAFGGPGGGVDDLLQVGERQAAPLTWTT